MSAFVNVCKRRYEIRTQKNPENSKRDIKILYRVIKGRDQREPRRRMTRNLLYVIVLLGASQWIVRGIPNRQEISVSQRGALSYVVGQGCPYLVQ